MLVRVTIQTDDETNISDSKMEVKSLSPTTAKMIALQSMGMFLAGDMEAQEKSASSMPPIDNKPADWKKAQEGVVSAVTLAVENAGYADEVTKGISLQGVKSRLDIHRLVKTHCGSRAAIGNNVYANMFGALERRWRALNKKAKS